MTVKYKLPEVEDGLLANTGDVKRQRGEMAGTVGEEEA